jgi:replication factor C small subunit
MIWTEKYRPKKFSEMKGQEHIVPKVEGFIKSENMPHLMFSGPAGVGKSSLAIVVARELFGDNWRSSFLELNASDQRGIDVIRQQVKDFARTKAMAQVPFKIIFLDECDALTREAQQALRRTMENYTAATRFILSCNYSSKIIDPIQSRCTIFRFKPLPKEEIFDIISSIANQEGIEVDEEAKEALYTVTGGDCRRLENIMQACSSISKKIDSETVYSISSQARPAEVKKALETAISGDFIAARKQVLKIMLDYGLSGLDIVKQIQAAVTEIDIDMRKKVMLIDKCGEIEFRMSEGSDEYVQLEALLANFCIGSDDKASI